MKVIKRKVGKHLAGWSIKLAVLTFIFYVAFILINQYIQINDKKLNLANLNSQLELQTIKNNELRKIAQASEEENKEYFIRIARELNLAKHNERIFINISGN